MRDLLNFLGELRKQDGHDGVQEEFNNFRKFDQTSIKDAKVNLNDNLFKNHLTLTENFGK